MNWLVGAVGLAGGAGAGWAILNGTFSRRLGAAATALIDQKRLEPRTDLPPAVAALTQRLGADGPPPAAVSLGQAGAMAMTAKRRRLGFTARQTICIGQPGFVWQARFAPAGLFRVGDRYSPEGSGGLEAHLFGAIPVMRQAGASPALVRAQLTRYLAELPWAPSAIVYNKALSWAAPDSETLIATAGTGESQATVRFHLDGNGDPVRVVAPDRYRQEKQRSETWRGLFSGFTEVAGCRVPQEGAVQWDSDPAPYWHAHITDWHAPPR